MKDTPVEHIGVAEARERLGELVGRAAKGETIVIERDDGSAARLEPQKRAVQPQGAYDWQEHWKWLQQQPIDDRPQQDLIDEWRGRERY